MSSRRRKLLFAVTALVLSGAVSLFLAELAARVLYRGPVVTGSLVIDDPELGSALRPGVSCRALSTEFRVRYVTELRHGLRVPGRRDSLPAAADVVVYGDSFVFGHGVECEQVFTSLLAADLPQRAVVNAGVFGYGPDQSFLLARRLRPELKPKLEIACFFEGNDFDDFARFGIIRCGEAGLSVHPPQDSAGRMRRALTSLWFYPFLCRFHLWHWAKAVLLERRYRSPAPQPAAVALASTVSDAQREQIECIAEVYRQWQAEAGGFRLFILPHREHRSRPEPRTVLLLDALRERGVRVVDAGAAADELGDRFESMYYPVDGHWRPEGHRWFADVVRATLEVRAKE